MKIALYSHSVAPSIDGVCRRFSGIFHELEKLGHQLLIFTLESNPEDLPLSATVVTLNHMFMPSYPGKKVAQPDLSSLRRIFSSLQQFQPDVLHVTTDAFSQMFAFACTCLRIPIVGSFHTDLIDLLTTHNAFEFQKWAIILMEFVDSLILDSCATTSVSFSKKLLGQGLACEHIINTAVNVKLFTPERRNIALRREMMFGDEEGILCVYVGRVSREKRLEVIIDAVKELDRVYLAIIGDGPSAQHYASLHSKSNRIYCKPGFLDHKRLSEVYASSDIHVSASEFETLGNTVLEAYACGIPVVVPKTQGFCDTVTDGFDGFLFKPGDKSDARHYILKLTNDKLLRNVMGQRAREKVSGRTIENVVEGTIAWYRRGVLKFRNTNVFVRMLRFVLLVMFIPFAMVLLIGYQVIGGLMAEKLY